MSVGILERTGVATPECIVSRVGVYGVGPACLLITTCISVLRVTLCPSTNSVALRGPSGTLASWAMSLHAHRARFKPFCKLKNATAPCSNSRPMMPSSITRAHRDRRAASFEIVDTKRNDGDACFHIAISVRTSWEEPLCTLKQRVGNDSLST